MSKFKSKLARRIMALILSGAMVMSNLSLTGVGTVYAAEENETEIVSETEDNSADVENTANNADGDESEDENEPLAPTTVTVTVEKPSVTVKEENDNVIFSWEAVNVKEDDDDKTSEYTIQYIVSLKQQKEDAAEILETTEISSISVSIAKTKFTAEKEYTFTAKATAEKDNKKTESEVCSTTYTAPKDDTESGETKLSAPENVQAEVNSTKDGIAVTWNTVNDAMSYEVTAKEQGESATAEVKKTASTNSVTFAFTGTDSLTRGKSYKFSVVAKKGDVTSEASAETDAVTVPNETVNPNPPQTGENTTNVTFDATTLKPTGTSGALGNVTTADLTEAQQAVMTITGTVKQKKASSSSATDVDSVEIDKSNGSIDITIEGTGEIKATLFSTGKGKNSLYALFKDGEVVTPPSSETTDTNGYSTASEGLASAKTVTYSDLEAGTYKLACAPNTANALRVSKIVITDVVSSGEPSERGNWSSDVDAPQIMDPVYDVSQKDTKISVKVKGVINKTGVGADKLTVKMFDTNTINDDTTPIDTVTFSSNTAADDEGNHYSTAEFTPKASGNYYFQAVLERSVDTDTDYTPKTATTSTAVEFSLPLNKPVISKADFEIADEKGIITLEWNKVTEADYYIVRSVYADDTNASTIIADVKVEASETPTATIADLAVGSKVKVSVQAFRGTAEEPAEIDQSEESAQRTVEIEGEVVIPEGTKIFESKKLTSWTATAKNYVNLTEDGYFKFMAKDASDLRFSNSDGKEFTFDDGYTTSQVLKFGGKYESTNYKWIEFTTTTSVEVKVWWNAGGNGRTIALYKGDAGLEKEDLEKELQQGETGESGKSYIQTFKIDEAGTYRIAPSIKIGNGDSRIAKIQVTEVAPARSESIDISNGLKQGTVYGSADFVTLEVLEDMKASAIADGKEIEGEKYFASIQGISNAKPDAGAIPTSGAAFKITAYMDANVTFVTGAAAGKKWHVVRESDQKEIASGKEIPEGKIKFRVQPGQTYYFYADGSKVKAYAITMEEYKVIIRDDWSTIAPPVIKTHTLKADGGTNTIELTVEGAIGETTGDEIAVEMYNVNDPDTVVTTVASGAKGSSRTVTFKPSESGSYFFKAFLSRNAEESPDNPDEEIVFDDKESPRYPAEGGVEFAYALQPPLISAVTNLGAGEDGKGAIEVDWGKASEATGYEVLVTDALGNPAGTELKTNQILDAEGNVTKEAETIGNVSGLTVGETYKVQVCAVRTVGETTDKSSYSDATEITITSDKKLKWSFSASGSSTSLSKTSKKLAGYQDPDGNPKNGYHKESTADNDFDVEVWSVDGAGKVVPATTDGLAFYYTELNPNDTNFTLTATAHVEQWTYSNGQDGFGLMVSDTVGEHGNGDYVWTNCYQNVVSKIEFRWDGDKPGDYSDVSLPRYSMKLGVGATEKIGATAKDIEDIWSGAISQPKIWSSSQHSIDSSVTHLPAGTYNIVGKATNQEKVEGNVDRNGKILNNATDSFENMQVDFDLILQKNNNGYKLSYTNKDTGVTLEKQFYGTDVLNQIESDKIYVGVFAGRNADVTFKNVHLDTYSPEADEPAQEQEMKYINLMTSIGSASTSNTSDYDLVFSSNWDGKLEIRNSDNVVVGKADVTGSLDTVLDQLEDGDDNKDTKAHVEISGLNIGSNVLTATFTPSKDMKNPPAYTALASYDPVTIVHTVDYRKYGNNNSILYVAQNGKSSGTGTKADPLDIFTAIKYVQPGQKIFLAGGRYALNKTISIARGINGEEGKMIYMMADPEAEERPVFDFQKRVTGMTLGGNYWYFKGFDVTGSLDGQKGIQLSGSHNVLDQINTYKNGNTGIQVSGSGNDTYKYWPSYNYILNCTSYLNSDAGYEDADGFAAKLTIGSGNVFDGCIAAYNADDGWDLFAKIESGQIGSVTIKNSIAYKNGYVLVDAKTKELSLSGEETDAGNGNGFKMGGDGLPGGSIYDDYYKETGKFKGHILENSLAFENKSKGFDSNSCPNNKIYNSISFNNKGGNVELYTYNNVQETDYKVENVLSFRTKYTSVIDKISPKGGQITDKSAFINEKTYLWNQRPNASINKNGIRVNKSWFKSVTFEGTKASSYKLFGRNADGSIDRNGFMEIDIEKMTADIEAQGHTMEESGLDAGNLGLKPTVSPTDEELKGDSEETSGDISAGAGSITDDDNSGDLYEEEQENAEKHGIVVVQDADVSYTGTAVKPEIRVYLNGKRFSDYSVSYKNNINAYVEGNANYSDIPDEKRPQMILKLKGAYREDYIYYFDILPVDIGNKALVAAPDIAVDKAQVPKVVLTHNGKKLSLGKDFNVYTEEVKTNEDGTTETTYNPLGKTSLSKNTTLKAEGIGNYAGEVKISFIMVDTSKLKLMSKAKIKLAASTYTYTGSEIVPDITLDGTPLALAKVIEKGKDENGNEIDVETDVYAKDADGNYYDKSGLYTVRIANGTEVGKATVTVTAKTIVPPTVEEGTEAPATPTVVYAGSTTAAFTINKAPIKIDNIVFVSQKDKKETIGKNIVLTEQTYTGSARVQQGTFKVVIDGTEFSGIAAGSRDINKVDRNTNLYLYNYTYQYKNNIEAGNASVIIKGIHNCTGSVTLKFKITPASAGTAKQYRKPYTEKGADGNVTEIRPEKLTGTGLEVVYDYDVTYVSSGAKPAVSVYYNGNGVSKKNFAIAYKNNRNAGDMAQAIITWKGGLKGAAPTTLEYKISKCKLEDNVYVKSISDVFTNGKTSVPASELDKSKAVIMNVKTKLSVNRDYTLEYEYDEYGSDLKAVPAKNADGTEIEGVINRKIYDSTDKNARKNPIYVPKTGLDVAVYIKPVSGGRVDNYETSTDGGRVKVADIRIAYFDIAKANIKLIDPATGKTPILYYNDKTELASMSNSLSDATLNQLDSKYIQIYHAAYAKEYGSGAKDYYVKLTDFGKKTGDGYTYDKTATGAVSAGTQKVTFYGTGLFGGNKVFKYKLEKKTYNISKAIVDTKTGIYLASDEYLALTDNSKISKELQASLEAQLTKAFEGKITNVNGINAVLASDRYICTYDIKDLANCKSGKAITVIIKGTNSYSGIKKVKIKAKMISSNLGKASVSAVTVEAPKDDIADGIVFGKDDSALNKAIAGKIKVDDYTLTYGVDYTENDAEYIVFAKDEEGNYIVDAAGETMMDENGEVIKDENGNPIKYKVVRKYTGYYNNNAVSTEETPAYVCIKGIGSFEGVLEVAVTIKEAEEKTAEQEIAKN